MGLLLVAGMAQADPRPFTFTTDTYSEGKGNGEYEQWVTYKAHKDAEPGFERLEVRHEVEFGLAENFDLAIYAASWSYEDSAARNSMKWDNFAVEGIVYLLNPVTDPIGLGLYLEVAVGEESLTIEPKLLIQKDIGKWVFAYNLVPETEIEGIFNDQEENEVVGELEHTFGVSYAAGSAWMVGGELIVASEFADWSHYEHTTVYAGPVISWRSGEHLWATLTAVAQLTDESEEPDYMLRMIAGWEF